MADTRRCPTCGGPVASRRRRYCGPECQVAALYKRSGEARKRPAGVDEAEELKAVQRCAEALRDGIPESALEERFPARVRVAARVLVGVDRRGQRLPFGVPP